MTAKNSTFAGQLKHFAESVDIVDDTRFDSVRELVYRIPIREQESPPAPFDFAAERILQVPRSRSGDLNKSRLGEMLKARITTLLSES